MTKKTQIAIAGISGFLAVALGAFGAHGLKNMVNAESLEIYKTGVLYQLIHSVVLLAIAFYDNKKFNSTFIIICIGIILFSFSLYIYAVTNILLFAMITPLGGISFLLGWVLIVAKGFKET